MADYWYMLRDDAPDWARDLHDAHVDEYSDVIGEAFVDADIADMVLDKMSSTLTTRYAEHATIEAFRGCFDRWEVVASLDHGPRAADETMVTEIAILASIVMRPVLAYMVGADTFDTNPYTAACDKVGYDGDGWADDVEGSERISWLHDDIVFYRNYDQCSDVIVETSADAGMTWFLVRANEDGS